MDPLDDIVKEFLVESYEILDRLDQDLLALEEVPDDRDRTSRVFRAIHSIKGTSGFLGFTKLERVTHAGENLLVLLRDGKVRLNSPIASALLAMVDVVRTIMRSIESVGSEGEGDYRELVATLNRLQNLESESGDSVSLVQKGRRSQMPTAVTDGIRKQVDRIEVLVRESASPSMDVAIQSTIPPKISHPNKSPNSKARAGNTIARDESIAVLPRGVASPKEPTMDKHSQQPECELAHNAIHETSSHHLSKISPALESESQDKGHVPLLSDTTVRIDVHLLDRLMNLVGELVLTRNQILQFSRSKVDNGLVAASQRLNLITSELQEGVMKTRMQPIHNVWAKLPRIVRDLAVSCGKRVQVKMEGSETELDKTILEAIRDPLTHIVRNSVDHGIESPEIRIAKGKPSEGTLLLRAFHEGGQVNIEISDDGAGIRLSRVKDKAITQRLLSADQAATMSEQDIMNLILLPGFSTADSVTNVSGRGVGMDVVKTNVERIGGTLDISSVEGEGTILRIKIPLTLAIVPALMVTCCDERYAIPQNNLVELVRIESENVRKEVEHIHDVPVYRLRGNLLPLLYLDEQLQLRARRTASELTADVNVNIVVLSAEGRQFGLVVDQVNDSEEIVVKPLGPQLKDICSYAGVTIMGDGAVALILDVVGMAKKSGVIKPTRDENQTLNGLHHSVQGQVNQAALLLGLGPKQRLAIPLSLVARLEEIPKRSVELSDGRMVVQYGGRIMPLISLSDFLNSPDAIENGTDTLNVVVYSENDRCVGVIVDQILDIVDAALEIRHSCTRPGILGSTVIHNRVTDLLDLQKLISEACPNCSELAESMTV